MRRHTVRPVCVRPPVCVYQVCTHNQRIKGFQLSRPGDMRAGFLTPPFCSTALWPRVRPVGPLTVCGALGPVPLVGGISCCCCPTLLSSLPPVATCPCEPRPSRAHDLHETAQTAQACMHPSHADLRAK